jgi:putative ABC transport system permease protein
VLALWQDFRFGLRMLAKSPGFTAVAVVTLALGIGANTAIFSVVNAVLLEPLPYRDSGELVDVWSTMISQGVPISGASAPDFREWRNRNSSFTGMEAFYYGNFDLAASGTEPSRLQGAAVSPEMFPLLGVNPALGRGFLNSEAEWGHHRVALLSDAVWRSKFASDPAVLGRTIHLDGEDFTIVGVLPHGMPFFDDLPPVDLYVPLSYAPGDNMNSRGNHYLYVVARLKPGLTLAQSQSEMARIASQLEKEFPVNKGLGAKVVSVRDQLVGDVRTTLLVLLGAVAFVLLIACVNVANLMLARATAREQEFAVRASLGASRTRIVSQLFLESLPIALLGGLGGILLAVWGTSLLVSLMPSSLPRFNPIDVNIGVLAFTAAVSLFTALLFGLAPAFHAAKADVQDSLRESGRSGNDGRSHHRLRSVLVVSEVALAMLLLVGSGLLIKTLAALRHTDPGFSPTHVLTVELPLSPADFPDHHEDQALQFFHELVQRIDSLPGVRSSGATTSLPLGGGSWGKFVDVQGHVPPTSLDQVPVVRFQLSTSGYFPAIGVRLREGRFFTDADTQTSSAVAIINASFAKRFFPGEDPVGKQVRMLPPLALLPPGPVSPSEPQAPMRTVVGVIDDMKDAAINQPVSETVFAPYAQYAGEGWNSDPIIVVRATADPLSLTGLIRNQVRSLVPGQPIGEIAAMDDLVGKSLSQARFSMLLLTYFAGLALALAAIGTYGVMSYSVLQRTREIGIRVALGAPPKDVLLLVLKQGSRLALAGLLVGIVAALALTRLMASLLYGVQATDPVTFASVSVLLGLVTLIACYVPARRAMRVDPMIALRYE